MVNIAFVAAKLKTGGAERQWLELIKGMDQNEFRVVVICLYELGEIGEQIEKLGIKSYSGLLKSRFSFPAIRQFSEILKRERIDIVFLWNQPLTMIYGIAAAKTSGIDKLIAVIHNTGYIERKFRTDLVNRFLMGFIKKVVALGVPHKQYIIEKEHVAAEKIVIIYNGVNVKDYEITIDKQRKKEELGVSASAKVVGIIARLHKAKRHDIFLNAAKQVAAAYKDVFFIIVGDGEERDRIREQILELGLGQQTKMLGLRKDIAEINQILDVSVLVSDSYVETLPMSVIEAMSSSLPVVSTDVGSLSDLVSDGENGFLVKQGAVSDVADAILKVLRDDQLALEMGRRGHTLACEKFSREAMVKGYESLFHDTIQERPTLR